MDEVLMSIWEHCFIFYRGKMVLWAE